MIVRRIAVLALACLVAGCTGAGQAGPAPASSAATPAPGSTSPRETAPRETAPERTELVQRLRAGGHVLYIRHAATEATQDDPAPDLADPRTQRNLTAEGREQARRIGEAVRRLRIPVGRVLASPYRRTMETAQLAFGRAEQSRDLLNEAYPGTDDARLADGLRGLLRQRPRPGTNTVLVSHGFNLNEVTGLSVSEGDTVVFRPGTAEPLTEIGVDEWSELARRSR